MFDKAKSLKIKSTIQSNKLRRLNMDIKVFEVKIDGSHLSKNKLSLIKNLFLEAKWLYNHVIASGNIFSFKSPVHNVNVLVFNKETGKCDIVENRELTIGSQIKQSIIKRASQNIINLSKAKSRGFKIGKLKFVKEVSSIPLKQFGTTFKIKGKNHVQIQGLGKIRVCGLKQLQDHEIANANLIKKASGFFLKITCYCRKELVVQSGEIGLDFGIKNTITDSNGEKISFDFPIEKNIKTKQKRLSRKKVGSKNFIKQKIKLKKAYEKLTNKKNNQANQFVSSLKKYKKIVIQDENLRGWHSGLFGKKVQNSILGRIKTKIKNLETSVVIDRYLPTTKISPINGENIKIGLKDRAFQHLEFQEDRDVKSAKTILCLGLYKPDITRKELMSLPVEERVSIFSNYKFEQNKPIPKNQEAKPL